MEYLDGKLVIHDGEDLEIPALTNSTYDRSIAHVRAREGDAVSTGTSSLSRFHRAAESTQRKSSVQAAWEGLEAVQWDRTQWQIVYEPETLVVHFRTRRNPDIRSIDLARVPSSCATPVPVLSMQAPGSGSGSLHR